jgi:hypothetical protein
MLRKIVSVLFAAVAVLAFAIPAYAQPQGGRHGALGEVYVTSQGLYYDTFVTVSTLPQQGPFQLLTANHTTEFGPGEPGYLGGRWWVDVNGDGIQDAGDMFLLCPLLGPGSPTP